MINPEQWPWAEAHAVSFVQFASDMVPVDHLGDMAHGMLRAGAVRKAAQPLLDSRPYCVDEFLVFRAASCEELLRAVERCLPRCAVVSY
jgi:hypothetical protein